MTTVAGPRRPVDEPEPEPYDQDGTLPGRTEEGQAVEVTRHVLGRGWKLRYGVPLD